MTSACGGRQRSNTQDSGNKVDSMKESTLHIVGLDALDEQLAQIGSEDGGPDFHNRAFFFMHCFKVLLCPKRYSHDWGACPYAHLNEGARRRDPQRFNYSSCVCPNTSKGECPNGQACPYAHTLFEYWLHPQRFRTQMCKSGASCKRALCFFAHSHAELRSPSKANGWRHSGGGAAPGSSHAAAAAAAAAYAGPACLAPATIPLAAVGDSLALLQQGPGAGLPDGGGAHSSAASHSSCHASTSSNFLPGIAGSAAAAPAGFGDSFASSMASCCSSSSTVVAPPPGGWFAAGGGGVADALPPAVSGSLEMMPCSLGPATAAVAAPGAPQTAQLLGMLQQHTQQEYALAAGLVPPPPAHAGMQLQQVANPYVANVLGANMQHVQVLPCVATAGGLMSLPGGHGVTSCAVPAPLGVVTTLALQAEQQPPAHMVVTRPLLPGSTLQWL